MKNYVEIVKILDYQYKTTSIYGNPSYWVWFEKDNTVNCGYTGSNCVCGYAVRNYKKNDTIEIIYHYTKTGSIIITDMK